MTELLLSLTVIDVQAAPVYDLDPDNASILVAGGGGVALHVTRRLKNMGSWVWQLQRTDVRRKVSRAYSLLLDTGQGGAQWLSAAAAS
jgi:hypothetical protein